MRRRNWKHAQPSSLRQALEWCKEYARERHNLSVERIAERMGLPDHSALYKWLANGRMPMVLVPVYERACGINLISRWLASTAGKVLIDVPTGRAATTQDTQRLQEILTGTTGTLLAFYTGKADAPDTLAALQNALEELAWHRGNVQQHANPQLELGEQQ